MHQPQSRLSVDDLLLKEESATHKTDTASQPQLVPSGENQIRPGSCPPSTQVSRGTSVLFRIAPSSHFCYPARHIEKGSPKRDLRSISHLKESSSLSSITLTGLARTRHTTTLLVTSMSFCPHECQGKLTPDIPACQYIRLKERWNSFITSEELGVRPAPSLFLKRQM